MIGHSMTSVEGPTNATDDADRTAPANSYCRDYIRGCCTRENCRFIHEIPHKVGLKELFRFCHDYQNKGCFRNNCKFIHATIDDQQLFFRTGVFPRDARNDAVCEAHLHRVCTNPECKFIHSPDISNHPFASEPLPIMSIPPPPYLRHPPPNREDDIPPDAKLRRFEYKENLLPTNLENQCLPPPAPCSNCDSLDHKLKLSHDNISMLLKKVADLTEKNVQLTTMNKFLWEQTASLRNERSCVITTPHGTSAPVSLATVSVTPVVSLGGAIPTLVPAAATPNLALAPAVSRAQLLTPAPQLLTVSTTQQLMGNSGTLIVTSAGAQQLMQVSDSGNLMGGGQTVVAVTPAQLTLGPATQQLMSSAPNTTVVQQQVVQQQLVQPQLAPQHQASQFAAQHLAAQQSAQHLAAQQSAQAQVQAQHLAQQNAQHLAQQTAQHAQHLVQQNAQHLAAQQSQHLQSQQMAAAQQTAQQLAAQQSAQQMVHPTSTQQITISSNSQPMALPNSQAQPMSFPIISQSILPH